MFLSQNKYNFYILYNFWQYNFFVDFNGHEKDPHIKEIIDEIKERATFFKILDDFLNVRINPEFDMNRMDVVSQENLSLTQDSTGTTKAFYGKLLLANFGSYAQTLISNPIAFTNPLSKLDKFTFQLVQVDGTIVDNLNCEWNAVLQISETAMLAKPVKPVLIAPPN